MLSRTDLRGRVPSPAELRTLLPRAEVDVDAVLHQVRPLVDDVRERGVEAVLELSERFDGVRPTAVRVPARELTSGLAYLPAAVREALEEIFQPDGFVIQARGDAYRLSARARDRRRTRVALTGPLPRDD